MNRVLILLADFPTMASTQVLLDMFSLQKVFKKAMHQMFEAQIHCTHPVKPIEYTLQTYSAHLVGCNARSPYFRFYTYS